MVRLIFWLLAVTSTSAFADDAIVWRIEPKVWSAPDACIGFGQVYTASEEELCPDAQGALVIEGAQPFPTLLAQSSARGGLVRFSAGANTVAIAMPFMSQPLAARQLADGSTAILSVELELFSSALGLFRAHLSLINGAGEMRWTVPIGGMRTQADRDARSGFVAELSPGGDLIALVNNGQLRAVRVRRSDGRIEAHVEAAGSGVGSAPLGLVAKPAGIYSSVPFVAWVGQNDLHVAYAYGLHSLDASTLQPNGFVRWADALADQSLVARAFAPADNLDQLFLLTFAPSTTLAQYNCNLWRVSVTGQVLWNTLVPNCQADGLLEKVGSERLAFTGQRGDFAHFLAVADTQTGVIQNVIPLDDSPQRLATTATTAAYISADPKNDRFQVTGVRLVDGARAYRHSFDFQVDDESTFPPASLTPNLISNGTDTIAVHYGRSKNFRSLGFVARAIAAQTGALHAPIEPVEIEVATDVSMLGRSGNGLILSTALLGQRRIERVDSATGARIWGRDIPAGSPSGTITQVNDQRILVVESERLLEPERWRIKALVIDALTGADIFSDVRELSGPPGTFAASIFAVTLTADNQVLYSASRSLFGMHVVGLAANGQLAWDVVHADGYLLTRTEKGRQLVVHGVFGEQRLAALDPLDGSFIDLGPWSSGETIYPPRDVGAEDLWLVSVRRIQGATIFTVQRRKPEGVVWSREFVFTSPNSAVLLGSADLGDGTLALSLRNLRSGAPSTIARTLRLNGLTGATIWDRTDLHPAATSTGCREFALDANGDILCAESYGKSALEMSGVANAQTYLRRMSASTGDLLGVHWLAVESEMLRGLFRQTGPSTRIFRVLGPSGFAFNGPAVGARPYTTGTVGRIRQPVIGATGDLLVTSGPAARGTRFRLRNDSDLRAINVHWTLDVSQNSAFDSIDCSPGMLTGAQFRSFGAQGTLDLEPGEITECTVRWGPSVSAEMREASLYAWPDFDYLDRDPRNNVATALGWELFTDGFE